MFCQGIDTTFLKPETNLILQTGFTSAIMSEAQAAPPSGVPPSVTPSAVPTPAITAPNVAKKAASEGNPAFRAMGM